MDYKEMIFMLDKRIYDYTIFPNNSPQKFDECCKKIEKEFSDLYKNKLLIDVDGSLIQTYKYNGKDIDVYDDYDVGAVYVKSEIDLDNLFK